MNTKFNVLSDCHHLGLFNSLRLLFEKRLGGNLYRPIGIDWLDKGFWRMAEIYNNHPATVAQYLGINDTCIDKKTHYEIYEAGHDYIQKAITFDQFLALPIDIIIASIPQHIESFWKLSQVHPNKPKVIYQIGNVWDIQQCPIPNIMASAKVYIPLKYHSIIYHQEFDTEIFNRNCNYIDAQCWPDDNIYSFINCLNTASIYQQDWQLFQDLEKAMPEWNFKSFGGSCRDGGISGVKNIADKMREAKFGIHLKNFGDGYGHVLFNFAAVGRPVIIKEQYYLGKLGGELIKDGETCITIDGLSIPQIIEKINYYNESSRYMKLCKNTYENFIKHVDFDKEAEQLKTFLQTLY